MKKVHTIAEESFDAVMDELSKEIANTLTEIPYDGPWIAFDVFFGTLVKLILEMFEGCPEEDVKDVMATIQTGIGIGVLIGRAPKRLQSILDRTGPIIGEFIVPEWMEAEEWKEQAMFEAEEILKKARGRKKDDKM